MNDLSVPASTNVRASEYPRVHPDGQVQFQIKAPEARSVQLQPGGADNGLGPGPYDMVRDAEGVWSLTIPPPVPGFHYYWFLVDGFPANDPGSEAFFGHGRQCSGIEVPERGDGGNLYAIKDVPHGDIRAHWYHSAVTGQWRRCHVYAPPDYDTDWGRRYPVLYLQHGSGEDERGWMTQGRMSFIMDNLLAEGRAVPMLVIMDRGYTHIVAVPGTVATPEAYLAQQQAFADLIVHDIVPIVDATYRTIPDREHRAIAGLSMGAGQALYTGLTHLDTFAYIGSFSGGMRGALDPETSFGGVFRDPVAFNAQVRLLWFGAGTAEPRAFGPLKEIGSVLETIGVRHTAFVSPGTSHEWQTWRRSLHDFAPRLFRS